MIRQKIIPASSINPVHYSYKINPFSLHKATASSHRLTIKGQSPLAFPLQLVSKIEASSQAQAPGFIPHSTLLPAPIIYATKQSERMLEKYMNKACCDPHLFQASLHSF